MDLILNLLFNLVGVIKETRANLKKLVAKLDTSYTKNKWLFEKTDELINFVKVKVDCKDLKRKLREFEKK